MPDVSTRLGTPTLVSAVPATVATAVNETVIQLIHIANISGSDESITVAIGAIAGGGILMQDLQLPAGSVFHEALFLPLAAGEFLEAVASNPSAVVITVGGVDIT